VIRVCRYRLGIKKTQRSKEMPIHPGCVRNESGSLQYKSPRVCWPCPFHEEPSGRFLCRARVHDTRCAIADHDANIRHTGNIAVGDQIDVLGYFDRCVFLDQRCGWLWRLLRDEDCGHHCIPESSRDSLGFHWNILSEVAGKYNNPYSLTSGIFLNDPRESNSRCNDANKAGR
jgi:hypothetical protein